MIKNIRKSVRLDFSDNLNKKMKGWRKNVIKSAKRIDSVFEHKGTTQVISTQQDG